MLTELIADVECLARFLKAVELTRAQNEKIYVSLCNCCRNDEFAWAVGQCLGHAVEPLPKCERMLKDERSITRTLWLIKQFEIGDVARAISLSDFKAASEEDPDRLLFYEEGEKRKMQIEYRMLPKHD